MRKSGAQAALAEAERVLRCAGEGTPEPARSKGSFRPADPANAGARWLAGQQWYGARTNNPKFVGAHFEMMGFDPDDVLRTLHKAWSLSTASKWTASNPASGQCNVTSLLIHELFGGELLKTPLPAGDHFTIGSTERGSTSRRASSNSRSRTWICLRVGPRRSSAQQAINWPNSELLLEAAILRASQSCREYKSLLAPADHRANNRPYRAPDALDPTVHTFGSRHHSSLGV